MSKNTTHFNWNLLLLHSNWSTKCWPANFEQLDGTKNETILKGQNVYKYVWAQNFKSEFGQIMPHSKWEGKELASGFN